MVDLSIEASRSYWQRFNDSSVYKVIVLLESVEMGLIEGDQEFEQAIAKLGDTLDTLPENIKDHPQAFVDVISYLKTSRYLRLLQATDEVKPGTASSIIAHAERNMKENSTCGLFINRNIIFERFRLLSRVLAPERVKILAEALEEV
tara:strand:+ start:149 stop:589 length:441 start_codon:yes stop_codon:yes gene_type:complete